MIDLLAPGAYFRAGGGNVQRPHDHKPVISWASWNLDNGQPNAHGSGIPAFAKAVEMWEGAGIATFPWVHCRTLDDIRRLVSYCKSNDRKAMGLNLEDVESDFVKKGIGLDDVADELASWSHAVHMATLPWVQNPHDGNPPLDWRPLQKALEGRLVTALEIFCDGTEATGLYPGGKYSADITAQCVQHGFDVGLEIMTLMLQTKPPWTRASYLDDYAICHSLYTGDDIAPNAEAWRAWEASAPCVKLESGGSTMPTIGPDDGIRAFYNRMRSIDPAATLAPEGIPKGVRLEDYLTKPVKDWKAIDKKERTDQILKDDHDG